jgi:hypothetical protein
VSIRVKILVLAGLAGVYANAQSTQAPNVYNVLSWSSVFNQNVLDSSGNKIGVLSNAVPNVFGFSSNASLSLANVGATLPMSNMQIDTQIIKVNNAINTSIATALGVIPIASPASGVIFRTDPVTGVDLPASSTLGPVFTERAETIGKHKWYIGITHEDFHFTSLNGHSLNGLQVLDTGGVKSGITNLAGQNLASTGNLLSYPATFDIGLDVRLSQDVAFITYGVTDRFDVSLGLPVVHAAVSARTWNGILYTGDGGAGQTGPTAQNPNCWCAGTFNPGAFVSPTTNFTLPQIGQTSLGKTGFGDLLVRAKGTVVDTGRVVVALGADVRFQTGDAANYLGTGTTSVKPFAAMSLYTHSLPHGIVFAPHFNVGWQFSGKSILGGQLQPNPLSAPTTNGTVQYDGAPLISSKDYLPDVFSWAVGSEVALGRHNTIIIDILGNQIGWIHGAPNLVMGSAQGFSPITLSSQPVTATGLMGSGTTSYSQYSGAFGYKARLVGNLVFTFNALVRFDNNGLTARFTPLYGLGYSF